MEQQPTVHSVSSQPDGLKLKDGSRVAVIGGGPAGSFFSYFLLRIAERAHLDLCVDIYEPRDFTFPGPAGCNMCGGIISESLVQHLAAEGINLPDNVVQRGIDSYCLHMDVGSVRIETPLREKRIAAVHRGCGPRGIQNLKWRSFDGFLLGLAMARGARVVRGRVDAIDWEDGRPCVKTQAGLQKEPYDLVAATVGVNSTALKLFEGLGIGYKAPNTTKTYLCEFGLGQETIQKHLGSSMHVFLLNIPRLEFAALIPKGDYLTVCLLGREIDKALVQSFLDSPEVRRCLPPGWEVPADFCHCSPRINTESAEQPFADRMVFIGDCGATRLYKDGIGAAYRTAKAAATAAVFDGISSEDFRRHYWPACRTINSDNRLGKLIFAVTRVIQNNRFLRRGVYRMVSREQTKSGNRRRMSTVLWDTFTGSAPYRHVLLNTLHPFFQGGFLWNIAAGIGGSKQHKTAQQGAMANEGLGKVYHSGEIIVRQGDAGDSMYVIQKGHVEVLQRQGDKVVCLATLGEGDFFGEMALFERQLRSATVRAVDDVWLLTLERKTFMHRIHEDPSLAFRIMEKMCHRVRELNMALSDALGRRRGARSTDDQPTKVGSRLN